MPDKGEKLRAWKLLYRVSWVGVWKIDYNLFWMRAKWLGKLKPQAWHQQHIKWLNDDWSGLRVEEHIYPSLSFEMQHMKSLGIHTHTSICKSINVLCKVLPDPAALSINEHVAPQFRFEQLCNWATYRICYTMAYAVTSVICGATVAVTVNAPPFTRRHFVL